MAVVEPDDRFKALSEEEVRAALADPDPENEIAVEVSRLIDGYMNNFLAHVERTGQVPQDILRVKPRWPIEAAAMELTSNAIREMME